MARVHYVECTVCHKEYYLDQMLHEAIISNPKQTLKCPFCKNEFHPEIQKEQPPKNKTG